MNTLKLIKGDVAQLEDGHVLLVEEQIDSHVTGSVFAREEIPGPLAEPLGQITIEVNRLTLVGDFQVSWVSPARLAFKATGIEEHFVREIAVRAARRTGDGTKVVVTFGVTETSIVAYGPSGSCTALAYSKKQPPIVAIKNTFTSVKVRHSSAPQPKASSSAMEDWILGEGDAKSAPEDPAMLAQLFQEMAPDHKPETTYKRDAARWFDLDAKIVLENRIKRWSELNWPRSAVANQLIPRELQRWTLETKPEEELAQHYVFLFQPALAKQKSDEVISNYEDFLFDLDVDIEEELTEAISDPQIKISVSFGNGNISFAEFALPVNIKMRADWLPRFLSSSAAHGFLEVLNPISLEEDVPLLLDGKESSIEELVNTNEDLHLNLIEDLVGSRGSAPLVVLDGPGGSGKTTTLMRLAAMEATSGRKVAFVVASVPLKNRLRRIQRNIPGLSGFRKNFAIFSADAVTLGDRSDLNRLEASGKAQTAIRPPRQPGGGLSLRKDTLTSALRSNVIGNELPFLIAAHQIKLNVSKGLELDKDHGVDSFDSLFVDEAQIFYPQHWLLAFSLIVEKPEGGGNTTEIAIANKAKVFLAFDERQKDLKRTSMQDPLLMKIIKNDKIKVETQRSQLMKYALSFAEAYALAQAIDKRFATVKWARLKRVVRQTSSLADHASKLIQEFELSHPELYNGEWGGIGLSKKPDFFENPISRWRNPTTADDLAQTIDSEYRQAQIGNTLQLAVAIPDSWVASKNNQSWKSGEVALQLLTLGNHAARARKLAVGHALPVLRRVTSTSDASNVRSSDFDVQYSLCGRLELLVIRSGLRGKPGPKPDSSERYQQVLKRIVLDAIALKQYGPNYLLIDTGSALQGFEFGTLINLTGSEHKGAENKHYMLATRPRARLIEGTVDEVVFPRSAYAELCREILNAQEDYAIPFITPVGVADLVRGEGAASELASIIRERKFYPKE